MSSTKTISFGYFTEIKDSCVDADLWSVGISSWRCLAELVKSFLHLGTKNNTVHDSQLDGNYGCDYGFDHNYGSKYSKDYWNLRSSIFPLWQQIFQDKQKGQKSGKVCALKPQCIYSWVNDSCASIYSCRVCQLNHSTDVSMYPQSKGCNSPLISSCTKQQSTRFVSCDKSICSICCIKKFQCSIDTCVSIICTIFHFCRSMWIKKGKERNSDRKYGRFETKFCSNLSESCYDQLLFNKQLNFVPWIVGLFVFGVTYQETEVDCYVDTFVESFPKDTCIVVGEAVGAVPPTRACLNENKFDGS